MPPVPDAEIRPLRIGIFIALLPPEHHGGAELQADRLARELAARGHRVDVFARRQPGRARSELRAGVHVHRRPVVPLPGLRLLGEVAFGAVQAARTRPDVLLCFMTMNAGLIGAVASRLCGAPFVIWQRIEAESLLNVPAWERRLALRLHRRSAGLWVQSEAVLRSLRREYESDGLEARWAELTARVRILGNGLDLPAPEPLSLPPRRFLFVGRLVVEKDLPTLLAAVRSVPEAELLVVGDGPQRAALERQAQGLAVRFLGSQPHDQIPQLLRSVRGLVLCSRTEGLPNVVLEALAHGRPVIATPVGAVPEIVRDGVNGRIVPIGDSARVAAAMREFDDDDVWRRFAAAARPSVERFAWADLVARVEAELAALVKRPVLVRAEVLSHGR